tara:strand:- start:35 stop:274 length:240 start_codon:yes stop_codon:yes gene_type:complete
MNKGKIFTLFLWLALAANYFLGFSIWINYFAAILLGVHAIEFVIFFKKIKNSNDSLIYGFFQTLIFGVLYIGALDKRES